MRARLLKDRVVYVGKLSPDNVEEITNNLLRLAFENRNDIRLLIDSVGGSVTSSLNLFEVIRSLPLKIIGVVAGRCNSMAIPLLQACHSRLATRFSSFFTHHVTHGHFKYNAGETEEDVIKRLKTQMTHTKTLNDQICAIISERTGRSPETVKEWMKEGEENGLDLTSQQAREMNLIDDIIDEIPLHI